jgi:hypothetical protein
MRPALLLPFALGGALAAAACGTSSERGEQTAFQVPHRDLTLQGSQGRDVEVASPVELGRAPIEHRASHRQPRAGHAGSESARAVEAAPAMAVAHIAEAAPAKEAPAASVSEPAEAPDPHALPPGRTVTILPVSDGASGAAPDRGPSPTGTDQRRGADPGIVGAMPPMFPGRGPCGHGGEGHAGGFRGGFRLDFNTLDLEITTGPSSR